MDTQGGIPSGGPEVERRFRGAWVEGDELFGRGLANDKGVLCAQMLAARAIKRAGVRLKADLIVTGVAQETSSPVVTKDGSPLLFRPGEPLTSQVREGVGSRWLVEHGIVADYAVVGEVSGFTIGTAQAGYLRLRIAVKGQLLYTPGLRRGDSPQSNPNPFERAAHVVIALEQWARCYEQEHVYEYWGGVVTPKAQVHEMLPSGPAWTEVADYCFIFFDIRLVPNQNPAEILHEVRQAVGATEIECEVLPYDYQPGYTAENAEPLITALTAAHTVVFGTDPGPPDPVWVSNWRDGNVFNGVGIPSVCYGPVAREPQQKGGGAAGETRPMLVPDLLATAKVFALTALEVCGVAE
jgi:acetylornithine deacetylase/succinyl-diaminopimelate desuccinylase-like protein